MLTITLSKTSGLDAIGQRWAELEPHAQGSFFQSWAWVGCLMADRFNAPLLLEARRNGALVGLAVFNRRRLSWPMPERLWLNESGCPKKDVVFVEHSGMLLSDHAADVLPACLKALLESRHPLTLSGVNAAHLQAAVTSGATFTARQRRLSPYVDLATLRRTGTPYLGSRSANTRYQLRRSAKAFATQGTLKVDRAPSTATALDYFDALGMLHQATWTGRGRRGAFANAHFVRFHRNLIKRAYSDAGVDLLRVTAGDAVLGYLYNLRYRGRISAYQSGFDYAVTGDQGSGHRKPGLTCHHLAIEHYLADGAETYDFLAGEDRYKMSMATATEPLYWLELAHSRSALGLVSRIRPSLRPSLDGALMQLDPSC